jgi:transposase
LEAGQERLFYDFRLEDQVPANHLLRKLDALLDFDMVRKQLEPFYSEIGRPSVDPELMIRMLLIGYCYSIRSERRLCDEVRFNLAYRWFCGLGLEAAVPHHSTFSVNRHGRFRESAAFRLVFESVVATCMGFSGAAHRRLLKPICRAGSPLLVVAIHGFAVQSSNKFLISIDFLTCFLFDNERSCARQVDRRSVEDDPQGPEEDYKVER